jgi:hypothetical protein
MMTESQLVTLGWRYELANATRAKAIRKLLDDEIAELQSPDLRQEFARLFELGRQEARSN